MKNTAAVDAILTFSAVVAAHAEWTVRVEGPDVFGNTMVLIGETNYREMLVVQCDSKDQFALALLFRKKEFEQTPKVAASFLVQIDGGQTQRFSAEMRGWNDKHGAIVAEERSPEMLKLLEAIAGARQRISVGAEIGGNQVSASFGASGSRRAVSAVMQHCKLATLSQ